MGEGSSVCLTRGGLLAPRQHVLSLGHVRRHDNGRENEDHEHKGGRPDTAEA
jgi:hypothetical protein